MKHNSNKNNIKGLREKYVRARGGGGGIVSKEKEIKHNDVTSKGKIRLYVTAKDKMGNMFTNFPLFPTPR